ncbi:MAG: acetate--CoA ligase [Deltaproteobacteria bacterium]|nr:acetate--CoA ligase [Deltaproteobacteria bacterium]
MKDFIWHPDNQLIENSNIARFMKRENISDYAALIKKSTKDIEWFWNACLKDLDIKWQKPYEKLLDQSEGFPWAKWFLGGEINIVDQCLDRHIQEGRGDKVAFTWIGDCGAEKILTYQELYDQVNALASSLKSLGVQKGDRVGLYLPMISEMVVCFFACLKLGAIIIPIFSGFGPEPLAVRLQNAEAKVLITADGSFRRGKKINIKESADQAIARVDSVKHVIVVKRTFEEIPWDDNRDIAYEDLLKKASVPVETARLDAEARSMIIYTSGTTGLPKGTVHTHAGCLAQMTKELAYYFDTKSEDVFFWVTDIGWMMGPWEIIGTTSLGASFVIFEGAPDYPEPDRLWRIVEKHGVTIFGISPTAIRLLMKQDSKWVEKNDLSKLRILGSTGEPWDPESYRWFFEKVGQKRCPIINISGGTELVGCLLAPLPIMPLKACTLGGPGLGMDVDVVDEEANSVRGEVGYLVCRQPAPSMTKSFWKDNGRYLETYFSKWPNIWFHGDWAIVDEEGYWFLQGRADDTIKVSGRRTGPAEIEAALMRHPACAEAAAIGVPHEIKGESIVAFVVLKDQFVESLELAEEFIAQVAEVLGKTLRPEKLYFVSALPKTRSAKIVRRAIKNKYLGKDLGDLSSVENPQVLDQFNLLGQK